MPLVSAKEILDAASSGAYAVGAFNINNMEILQGIVAACEESASPVIIAVSESAIKYAGFDYLVSMVRTAAEGTFIPMALHLDHGRDLEVIKMCIRGGFTSVMIDASHLPLEENIRVTREVVEMAHAEGVPVEGELGRLKGMEDMVSVKEREATLTDPEEAERFVASTGVDFLAPAIGTSHGAFKFRGEPKLDIERLREIKQRVGIPLVLHGASSVPGWILEILSRYGGELKEAKGVPPEELERAIEAGINKVNTDTDLRLAFTAAVRKVLSEAPSEFDPRKILAPARELIKKVVLEKVKIFRSAGRVER